MSRILVAYFSPTGTTRKLARRLATVVGGDLFEIVPEQPYTSADLNWQDKNSRSTKENVDRSSRPAIASKTDLAVYDTVFVGFPVWWYREPAIIDTFIEQYDFAGKKVIPFATSGSSGIGASGANLQALAPAAKVTPGQRFDTRATDDDLKHWAEANMH